MNERTLTFRNLIGDLPTTHTRGDLDVSIAAVCYDSRAAMPGSLFVALRGGYTDGHRFLSQARANGAVAALVEEWSDQVDAFAASAMVLNSRAMLAQVAARFYQNPGASLGIVGVTGTDGKTTTTYLVDALLRTAGYRTGLIGTVAVRIGDQIVEHDTRQTTPESLDIQRLLAEMRAASVDWAAIEATSHGLDLFRLDTCPFDIAVVTNITHEHIDYHGTIEAYRRSKARLLERVTESTGRPFPRGIVLNRDDAGARSIASFGGDERIIWFSVKESSADITASDIRVTERGTQFTLKTPDGASPVDLRLVGRFNVENALAAAGVGYLLGLDPTAIARGLEALESVPGRLTRVDRGQPFSVFVDYAHTPDSLEKMIRLIRSLVSGRIITVFGSAGERDRAKRPLQGEVSARLADFSVFTSEDPRFEDPDQIIEEIAAGARRAGASPGDQYLTIEDRGAAIRAAMHLARTGDAVLLAGKGHEQCIIYGQERRPWDEASEAACALEEMGFHGNRSIDQ